MGEGGVDRKGRGSGQLRKADGRRGKGGGYVNGEGSYLDGGWLPAAMLVLCVAACCFPSWRFKRSVAEGPGRAGTSWNGKAGASQRGHSRGRGGGES